MSLFGSSASVICADYFGDELPFPLPRVKKETGNKAAAIKPTQDAGSTNSAAAAKSTISMFGSSATAICADYFGDELPFLLPQRKIKTNKRPAEILSSQVAGDHAAAVEGARKNQWKIYSSIRSAVPSFDGLFSFETLSSLNGRN